MKFKLYSELVNHNDIMSHVFLNCCNHSLLNEVSGGDKKLTSKLTQEEIEDIEVEIELKIHGKECNPRKFFELLWEQYVKHVKDEATEIVKQQTSHKLNEIRDKMMEFEEICDEWANELNWDVDNKFKK